MTADRSGRPVILLGVTSDQSLLLMRGFPDYLKSQGWEVHVVCSPGPRLEILRTAGSVTCHDLLMARDPSPLADLRSLFDWIRLVRSVRPDVVSVGTPKAALLGSTASWLSRVPRRAYLVRGLRLETVSGPGRTVLSLLERLTVLASTDVIAVSHSLRDLFLQKRLARPTKVSVVGSGSSNGVVIPNAEDLPPADVVRGPVVGFVGRANPDKGIDLLAAAIEELARRGVHGELLLVGDDEDGSRNEHLRRVEATGWTVTWPGHVSEVAPHYDRMRVLCLPTKREGFPNVVLEAAARRVPCVATLATGIPDAIEDGLTGTIVRERTPEALADALAVLLADESTALRLGAAARERAIACFERGAVWKRYDDVYREYLKGVPS